MRLFIADLVQQHEVLFVCLCLSDQNLHEAFSWNGNMYGMLKWPVHLYEVLARQTVLLTEELVLLKVDNILPLPFLL